MQATAENNKTNENALKILILRLSSIGDILLCTALIRQIRTTYPDAQIDFIIKKEFFDLLRYNPHLNTLYEVDKKDGRRGLKELRQIIKKNDYDYILDLHNNFRTNYLHGFLSGTNKNKIKKDYLKRLLLVKFKINIYDEVITIPQRYFDVARELKVEDDHQGLEIHWHTGEIGRANELSASLKQKPYFVLACGAGFFSKQWPLEYFRELIQKLLSTHQESIVILGSKSEAERFRSLVISDRVRNLAGELTLLEAAAVIAEARAVVSNDSGLMHMATAVKTPVLAIFGSTVEELGFFPFRSEHRVLQNIDLNCRPCSHIGKNHCPKKHFKCMRELTPDMAYYNLLKLIGSPIR